MKLESPKVTVTKSQKELFEFLTNIENYKQLMPDSLAKFDKINDDTFSFQLKGMPEITLQIQEKNEPNSIKLGSTSSSLNFSLNIFIDAISDTTSQAQLLFDGKFNPMMAMMVKKPLQSFIETLSKNLGKVSQ